MLLRQMLLLEIDYRQLRGEIPSPDDYGSRFPGLASGNISYKLLQEVGNNEAIGPILMGMRKPVHVLQMGSSVREIVNMVAIAVVEAQRWVGKN